MDICAMVGIVMEKIKSIILNSTAYTVVILLLFYFYALIGNLTHPAITFGTFLIILLFGFVISLANMIFEIEKLHYAVKLLIHYSALLVSFIFVFIIAGKLSLSGIASVFSAIIIFTFLYAVIYAISYGAKSALNSAKKSKKSSKSNTAVNNKPTYKPLYGDDDKK